MKIRFVTNACFEIVLKEARIFCDPWLVPGAFDGSWWQWPPLRLRPEDFTEYTHLYISHIHTDHCDPKTLNRLPNKDVPVIILKRKEGFLRKRIESCGFKKFIELEDGESLTLPGNVVVTMYSAFTANPFIETDVPNIIDSSIVVTEGGETFLNCNDNTPNKVVSERLIARHGQFRAVTVPYSGVGPFPSSYNNLSLEEKRIASEKKTEQYLARMIEVASILKADVFFPLAGQMRIGGKQMWKNEVLGVASQKTAAQRLIDEGFMSAHLQEGDVYDLTTFVQERLLSENMPTQAIIEEIQQSRYWWQDAFHVPKDERQELLPLLQAGLSRMRIYQQRFSFSASWTVAIQIEETPDVLYSFSMAEDDSIRKRATKELKESDESFLIAIIPYDYLIAILTRHCHWNNAYHGCQIEWYRKPDEYKPELQMLLSFFHL